MPKKQTIDRLSLFLTGFTQVYFVSVNTYFLAKELYIGVFFAAFMISIIWSFNVKKVVLGNMYDRLTYSFGAALGSVFGLFSSSFVINILNNSLPNN